MISSSDLARATRTAVVVLVIGPGCTDLPEIAEGACGNAVVDASEDCDTFVTLPGGVCRAPTAAGACRWDCTADSEGNRPACPDGWGCGADALCRAASGSFEAAGAAFLGTPLLSTEVDGDGRADLMTQVGLRADLRFFDEEAGVAATFALPIGIGDVPAMGDLTKDGRSDVALRVGYVGIGTLKSNADRTLEPVLQPSIALPPLGEGERIVTAEARADLPGREVFDFGFMGTKTVLVIDPDITATGGQLFALAKGAEYVAPVAVGDLDEQTPCEEIVLGYLGGDIGDPLSTRVFVHPTCTPMGTYAFDAPPAEILLPAGRVVAKGMFVADVNGDGYQDVLVASKEPALPKTYVDVAFGQGDGTFHSKASELPTATPDGKAATGVPPQFEGGPPLAAGDLNLDGRADLVMGKVILMSQPGPGEPFYPIPIGVTGWSEALIGDFNANGLPDIVGARVDAPGIDFYNGAGDGSFATFTISTDSSAAGFVGGDFDGDLVDDVACVLVAPTAKDSDSFVVLFGQTSGPPEDPVTLGRVPFIRQIAGGRSLMTWTLLGFDEPQDAADDLLVLTQDTAADSPSSSLSIVLGTSTRLLQSPLLLFPPPNERPDGGPDVPVLTTFGRFRPGSAGDVCSYGLDANGLDETPEKADGKFWFFASAGDGRLATPVSSDVVDDPAFRALGLADEKILFPQVAMATGDLDADSGDDAVDEIVTTSVSPKLDGSFHSAIAILRFEGETVATEIASTPHSFGKVLLLGDVDGNGLPDLVTFESTYVPPIYVDATQVGAKAEGLGTVLVFWNDGGKLDLDAPTILEPADGVHGLALLNADGDPQREIVTTGDDGIHVFDAALGSRTLEGRQSVALPNGGGSLAAGDFNGDGVEDLAMADFGGNSIIFLGLAVRP